MCFIIRKFAHLNRDGTKILDIEILYKWSGISIYFSSVSVISPKLINFIRFAILLFFLCLWESFLEILPYLFPKRGEESSRGRGWERPDQAISCLRVRQESHLSHQSLILSGFTVTEHGRVSTGLFI